MRELVDRHGHEMSPHLVDLITREWTAEDFTDAQTTRKAVVNAMWRFMRSYDLLLTPTLTTPPFAVHMQGPERVGGRYVRDTAWLSFTYPFNLTGQPAATVPAGFTRRRAAGRAADRRRPPRRRPRAARGRGVRGGPPVGAPPAAARRRGGGVTRAGLLRGAGRLVAFAPLVLLAACGRGAGGERERTAAGPAPGALVRAAAAGDTAEVRRLLAAGADVDGRTAAAAPPSRPPRSATTSTTARALIDAGADVDLQDADRNNPLLVCGETGDVAMLREVLRAKPDLGATNRFGGTALIPASDRGHVDMVRALLRDRHRRRPRQQPRLDRAARGRDPRRGRAGAPADRARARRRRRRSVDLADRDGVTPLEHARSASTRRSSARSRPRARTEPPHAAGRRPRKGDGRGSCGERVPAPRVRRRGRWRRCACPCRRRARRRGGRGS